MHETPELARLQALVERGLRADLDAGQTRNPLAPRREFVRLEKIERSSAAGPIATFVTRDSETGREYRPAKHVFHLGDALADQVDAALAAADVPVRRLNVGVESLVSEIREKGGARVRMQFGGSIVIAPPRPAHALARQTKNMVSRIPSRPRASRRRRRVSLGSAAGALARGPSRPRPADDPPALAGARPGILELKVTP